VILARYGEVMLKGLNRRSFEEMLARNIKRAIRDFGPVLATIAQGRIFVEPVRRGGGGAAGVAAYDFEGAAKKMRDVFGVVSVSIAERTASEQQAIRECAARVMRERCGQLGAATRGGAQPGSPRQGGAGCVAVAAGETGGDAASETGPAAVAGDAAAGAIRFKVETKRGDKRYAMTSPEVSRDVGEYLLGHVGGLVVDVNSPSVILYVEVREQAYVYTDKLMGFGGLPLGSNGKAFLLLSGGIDSPVAGFMMAKRGVEVEAVHFYSFPYTDERAREKVIRLAEILAGYVYALRLHIVPFTDIQLAIRDNCREEYLTIVMRRFMMVIADRLAAIGGAQALVTGESVGQVASQTIMGLSVTDKASELPVFRPLIGMDKNEIIEYARRIGTFETSILPYEDCCTVFTPKHPKTKPRLADTVREEARVPGAEGLIAAAVAGTECVTVYPERLA
jgi:thiamine biosynthesis protein ThiI